MNITLTYSWINRFIICTKRFNTKSSGVNIYYIYIIIFNYYSMSFTRYTTNFYILLHSNICSTSKSILFFKILVCFNNNWLILADIIYVSVYPFLFICKQLIFYLIMHTVLNIFYILGVYFYTFRTILNKIIFNTYMSRWSKYA